MLAKVQQQSQQEPVHQSDNQATTSKGNSQLKGTEKKLGVMNVTVTLIEPEQSIADSSSSTDLQALTTSDHASSMMTKVPNPSDAPIKADSPLLLSKKLKSNVTREAKTKPGQKIANVVKKLTQERVTHTPSIAAPNVKETAEVAASLTDDKNTGKSLDAVVAKLHIVKKQELDKQFHVDLGSAKQVRENSKLDSVVEKLVAKQTRSELFPSSYPAHFEALVNTKPVNPALDPSLQYMETDTAPDKLKTKSTKKSNKQMVGITDEQENSVIGIVVNKQDDTDKAQTKLVSKSSVDEAETKNGVSKLSRSEQADKIQRVHHFTKLPTGIFSLTGNVMSTMHKFKFVIENYGIQPKDLEAFLEKASSKEVVDDSFSGSLTEFHTMISPVHTQQDFYVSDTVLVKLHQVMYNASQPKYSEILPYLMMLYAFYHITYNMTVNYRIKGNFGRFGE